MGNAYHLRTASTKIDFQNVRKNVHVKIKRRKNNMKKITWNEYAINKLIEKWWAIMTNRIMTDEEALELEKDLEQVGISGNDFLNAMIEKIKE
mgnify:CR=1 FL=1